VADFTVSLDRYQGPLDLLLDLVRRGQYAIEDLPIAAITAQYLECLRRAGELDIELGSEFIHTAAVLIQIKSRALLPRDPALAAEPDPRAELARQLLTHEQARRAAEMLAGRIAAAGASWSAVREEDEAEDEAAGPAGYTLWDLLQKIRTLRSLDWSLPPPIVVEDDGPSQEELIRRAEGELALHPRLGFEELAARCGAPAQRGSLFLGVLELARRGVIGLEQAEPFGDVSVRLRR
jgi:segregation and condensation protein A